MLTSAATLQGYVISGTDGEIGQVDRLFFDDEKWVVRHLVVDTGKWLPGRRVLISPAAVERVDPDRGCIHLNLTREVIRNSPDVDTDKPVSRQQEIALNDYYGYGPYWGTGGLYGAFYYPPGIVPPGALAAPAVPAAPGRVAPGQTQDSGDDSHLRSTKEVSGYHVHAEDGSIGHIDGFLIEDDTWAIRYLVIDTSNWPGGESVLISPRWVREVDWTRSRVYVNATVDKVRSSPKYDPSGILDRRAEESLDRHYGQPHYPDKEGS